MMTRETLIRCLENHSITLAEFDAEHPVAESYSVRAVRNWLGY